MIVPSENVGYLDGSSSVTSSGEFTYRIPLEVPAGRAGMQPELALTYGSRRGNGLLGVGFAIEGLSEIRRCGKTLATEGTASGVDFDDTDRFCLDGQKLVAVNGVYGADTTEYRTERESFARIVSNGVAGGPVSFDVWTRDGHVRHYEAITGKRTAVDPG